MRSRLQAAAARGPDARSWAGTASWSSSARRSSTRRRGPRPGGRHRRRAGRRQVAPRLGVHPLPPHPGLARSCEAGSVSYGKATPYLPVIDLLKALLRDRGPRRAPARSGRRSPGKLLALDRALSRRCRPSWRCSMCPVEDRRWAALDPPQRRQRTLDALKRLLLRESQVQPLLVVFEDLHWIDCRDAGVARQPGREPADGPAPAPGQLPPRVPARLGQQDLLHASSGSTRCPPRAPRSCSGRCSATTPSLEPLKRLLIERTEGNPFFLEESVRTLVETGVARGRARAPIGSRRPLEHRPGAGHGPGDPGRAHRPAAGRGQASAPDGRRSSARTCPFALLQAIAGVAARTSCADGLAHLQAAEFLYETRLFPDLEYTFKHALTQRWPTAACSTSAGARSTPGSSRPSSDSIRDRLAEHVERLAHHALRGELWEKAVVYLRQAGRRRPRSAYREAVDVLRAGAGRARGISPRLGERIEQAIDLRFELGHAAPAARALHEVLRCPAKPSSSRNSSGTRPASRASTSYLINYHWMTGEPDQAIEFAQRVPDMATASGCRAAGLARSASWGTAIMLGGYRLAEAILRQTVEVLSRSKARPARSRTSSPYVLAWLASLQPSPSWASFAVAMTHVAKAQRVADASRSSLQPSDRLDVAGLGRLLAAVISRRPFLRSNDPRLCRETNLAVWHPDSLRCASGYAYAPARSPRRGPGPARGGGRSSARNSASKPISHSGPRSWGRRFSGRPPDERAEASPGMRLTSPDPEGARPRGVGPPPPRRDRRSTERTRLGGGRGALPRGPGPRRGARHAPPRRPLPPRPRQALPAHRGPARRPRSTSPPRRRCTARWT